MNNLNKFEAEFKTTFPKAWCQVGDFNGDGTTVLWSGEDSWTNDGLALFDYYASYGYDILPQLVELADKYGFYFECYDAGTYIAVER